MTGGGYVGISARLGMYLGGGPPAPQGSVGIGIFFPPGGSPVRWINIDIPWTNGVAGHLAFSIFRSSRAQCEMVCDSAELSYYLCVSWMMWCPGSFPFSFQLESSLILADSCLPIEFFASKSIFWQKFGKMYLVFSSIGTYLCYC